MDLRIKGLRYENIREFQQVELDFKESSEEPHHISLVQMPNGTGKTTTMDLTRTLLLGDDMDINEVKSFQPTEFQAVEGKFEADLMFNDQVFTLRLEMDYETGEHSYRHIKPQRAAGGDTPEHFLPLELENVMTESFVDLFVFNGELTEEFIQQGSEEAENALKIVNYLDRLDEHRELISEEVETRYDDKNVTTEQGYKNIQTRLRKRKNKLSELESEKTRLEDKLDTLDNETAELDQRKEDILSENEEALKKIQNLEKEITRLEDQLESDTSDLLELMRSPSKLSEDINEDLGTLKENMDILKLPKSTSEEFFRELSEGDECVCGRPIDEEHRHQILDNSSKYLSEQDIAVLNALKDRLRNTPEYGGFEATFEGLTNTRDQLMEHRQRKTRLDIDDPDISEEYERISKKIHDKESEREEAEEMLTWLTTNDINVQEEYSLDWESNIPLCKSRINKLTKDLREASGTVNFGKKADILEQIFDSFVDRTLETLKERQIEETNKKLKQILGLSEVQIEAIDDSIIIEGREDVSEGQRLSIAYAYLATLFEDSALSVPFVIDSPAVSIDYDKREEVAQIIPNLFNQLVIFVISPERRRFVDVLDSDDIQYFTIHKTDTKGEIEKNSTQDFFMNFQSEEEREGMA